MSKLSILIPTLENRAYQLAQLLNTINLQLLELKAQDRVEIKMVCDRGEQSIGAKRNELLRMANNEYVCFIDDDDMIEPNYIRDVLKAIESNPDCVSLTGIITWNGVNPEKFEHSIKYSEWKTNDTGPVKYERTVNHLNVIKASIAKAYKFPDIYFGEDHSWSQQIHASGLLKNEYYIDNVLYNYNFIPNK